MRTITTTEVQIGQRVIDLAESRYGYGDEARQVIDAVIDAADEDASTDDLIEAVVAQAETDYGYGVEARALIAEAVADGTSGQDRDPYVPAEPEPQTLIGRVERLERIARRAGLL